MFQKNVILKKSQSHWPVGWNQKQSIGPQKKRDDKEPPEVKVRSRKQKQSCLGGWGRKPGKKTNFSSKRLNWWPRKITNFMKPTWCIYKDIYKYIEICRLIHMWIFIYIPLCMYVEYLKYILMEMRNFCWVTWSLDSSAGKRGKSTFVLF